MEELEIIFFVAENDVNPLSFPISKTEITIGRNKYKNDIVVGNAEISDVHAKIIINDINDYSIKDLQSETGVFRIINDNIRQRLKPNKEYDLNLNSSFFLGKYKCILRKKEQKSENLIIQNNLSPQKNSMEVMIPDSMKKLGESEKNENPNKELLLDNSNKNLEIVNKNIEEIKKQLEKPKEAIQIPKAYNKKFKPKGTIENQKTDEEKDHEKKLAEYNNKITHVISNEESIPFGKIDLKKNAEENLQEMRILNKNESIDSIEFSDFKIIERKSEIAKEENLKKKIVQKDKPNKNNDVNKKFDSKNINEAQPLKKNEPKKEEDFEIIIDINKNVEEVIRNEVEKKQLDNFNEVYFQKQINQPNIAKKLEFEVSDEKQQMKKKPTKKDLDNLDKIKIPKNENILLPLKDLENKNEFTIIEETKKHVESKEESELKKEKKIKKKEKKEERVPLEEKQPLMVVNNSSKIKTPEPMAEEQKIIEEGKTKRQYKKKEIKEPFKADQTKSEAVLSNPIDSKTLKSIKNKSSQKQTIISKNEDLSPQNLVETSFGKQEKMVSQKSVKVTPKINKNASLKRNPADKKENDLFFEKENKKLLLDSEKSKTNTPDFGSTQARSNRRKGFNVILSGFKLDDTVIEVLCKLGVKIIDDFDERVDYLVMVK